MFEKIGNQHARNSIGFDVLVSDREHISYEDAFVSILFESDMLCSCVPIYLDGIRTIQKKLGNTQEMSCVLERLSEGLKFLNIPHEFVSER